jgi:adenylyltransferase/sulfurtransferase
MTKDASLERYSRQMRFYGVGEDGQRKLRDSHVTLCGCGALGTVLANALVRAGVGHVRLVDRDFIETSNLQVEDADVILDGTDNFEIRYLINDAAVKLNKPWVYGGCIGSHGQTMTILPGETPCLRCVFEAAPAPGEAGTCETAGVLSPIVNIVASFQATEAIKILTGRLDKVNRELLYFDVWENTQRRIKIAPLLGKVDCPCCQRRRFEWIEGEHGQQTTSLCGRNAVQVAHRSVTTLNFETMARHLETLGEVSYNRFLLRFQAEGHEFTVFPDGRAIIKGTSDVDKARTLYAKYIGH